MRTTSRPSPQITSPKFPSARAQTLHSPSSSNSRLSQSNVNPLLANACKFWQVHVDAAQAARSYIRAASANVCLCQLCFRMFSILLFAPARLYLNIAIINVCELFKSTTPSLSGTDHSLLPVLYATSAQALKLTSCSVRMNTSRLVNKPGTISEETKCVLFRQSWFR